METVVTVGLDGSPESLPLPGGPPMKPSGASSRCVCCTRGPCWRRSRPAFVHQVLLPWRDMFPLVEVSDSIALESDGHHTADTPAQPFDDGNQALELGGSSEGHLSLPDLDRHRRRSEAHRPLQHITSDFLSDGVVVAKEDP